MQQELLTILIDGREAIPVRAIPYVTGWSLSPDTVAALLRQNEGTTYDKLGLITAYRLINDVPAPILPKEWDAIEASLNSFAADLRTRFPSKETGDEAWQQGYAVWRRDSPSILPAGAFVWHEEFEEAFKADFSEGARSFLYERSGDRELISHPIISAEIRALILDGFSAVPPSLPERQDAQQKAEKEAEGRYTLEEAAACLSDAGERVDVVLGKLEKAALGGFFPTYAPGERCRREYGSGVSLHTYWEEVYWSDLNAWLAKYEPRIPFRFPAPHAESIISPLQQNPACTLPPNTEYVLFGQIAPMLAHAFYPIDENCDESSAAFLGHGIERVKIEKALSVAVIESWITPLHGIGAPLPIGRPGGVAHASDRVAVSEFVAFARACGVTVEVESASLASNTNMLPNETSQPSVDQPTVTKLTADQREQIVKRANDGEKHTVLANEFGVSRQYVSKLCSQEKKNAQPNNSAFSWRR